MKARLAVVALLAALGCNSNHDHAADKPATAHHAPAAHYTVKGKITALPGAGSTQIEIYNERIPAFHGFSGKTAPMEPMAMPYGVGSAHLDGLAVGDAVELGFDVDYDATPPLNLDEHRQATAGDQARRRALTDQ